MLIRKTMASSSATQGRAGRPPTIIVTHEITIAAPHGHRWARHSSQGVSPPQYCDASAAPSTTALAAKTKAGKARVRAAMPSKIAQHQETANEGRCHRACHQHQPALDKVADRRAEAPQQGGQQKESEAARDERGQSEGEQVELRDAARDRHELERDRRQSFEDDYPNTPLRKARLQGLVFVHRVIELEHRPADCVKQEITDCIADKAAEHRADRADSGY